MNLVSGISPRIGPSYGSRARVFAVCVIVVFDEGEEFDASVVAVDEAAVLEHLGLVPMSDLVQALC